MHAYDFPTWLEKPSIGVARIKFMMSEAVFPFDANRERVNRERLEAEAEIMNKVPDAQKAAFGLLMKAAQKSGTGARTTATTAISTLEHPGRWNPC